jgi:hypothetical protein
VAQNGSTPGSYSRGADESAATSSSTTTITRGDVGRYLAGRERVLGHRVTVPEDPDGAAEVLAGRHGSRHRAAAWLREVLYALDGYGGRP